MPGCPRAPGAQLPSKSDMELPVPYKRCVCNLTCYGLLRPVTVSGDENKYTVEGPDATASIFRK